MLKEKISVIGWMGIIMFTTLSIMMIYVTITQDYKYFIALFVTVPAVYFCSKMTELEIV